MRAIQILPLLLLLVSAVSCSTVQAAEDPSTPPPAETTVEVRNLRKVDVNLFVLRGASRVRLGTVPGMSTRSFVIPPHLIGQMEHIRFGVDTIGADDYSTSEQELPVQAGDQLSLTLN